MRRMYFIVLIQKRIYEEEVMKRNYVNSKVAAGILLSTLLLTGCSSAPVEEGKDTAKEEQVSVQKEDSSEKNKEEKTKESKEKADVEALAAEGSFHVNWFTKDGEYASGTAFLMDSEVHGEKLLVTAFHFLWPDDADTFTGSDLPEFVLGGEIYYTKTDEPTYASLKNCVVIEDADSVPAVDKDVAAFTIQGGDDLKTLKLAKEAPKKGDKVYLLASLWDTEDIHENCVYEGEVADMSGGALYFTLDGKPGTAGASGGPIVNEYGEVVAIHMASNPMFYIGHTADSFLAQINAGTISDITYPECIPGEEESSEAEENYEIYEYEQSQSVDTLYFDMQIDKVELADTLNGQSCEEGYRYVILDISMERSEDISEPVSMFYLDFTLEWEDEYCYPLEPGLTENQLADEYSLEAEATKGQLVFMAPMDAEETYFTYVDYYFEDQYAEEPCYMDIHSIKISMEDWSR